MASQRDWVYSSAGADGGIADLRYNRRTHVAEIWLAADEPTPLDPMPALGFPTYLVARFHFEDDSDDVRYVELRHADPLRGSDLQRFAWSQWLARARDLRAVTISPETPSAHRARSQRLWATLGSKPTTKRPGRRGYGDEWWQNLGAFIDSLGSAGVTGRDLIDKLIEKYDLPPNDRPLAQGWLKLARKNGYARRGRPGRPPKRKDKQ